MKSRLTRREFCRLTAAAGVTMVSADVGHAEAHALLRLDREQLQRALAVAAPAKGTPSWCACATASGKGQPFTGTA